MPSRFQIEKYGVKWTPSITPIWMEMQCIEMGGTWVIKKGPKKGQMAGNGLEFHYKELMTLLWPHIVWHDWAILQLKCYLEYRIIGQLGAASTGKTFIPSACVLADYYCFPNETTILVSSTTLQSLDMRVLGEIKKLHKLAKERVSWLPGYWIEGDRRIITDQKVQGEGRDFRNGLQGIAVKRGNDYQGIESYIGIKNKRLRIIADELQFLPRQFIDAISNMNKNPDFKCIGSGNPKSTLDALGVLCEPAAHLGGWDGGLDQIPKSKTWETRFAKGICIQLVGTDSPNLDGKLGIDLITQEQIDADIKFYGEDSLQFSMMDMGRMPRGMATKRVLTRQMCLKFQAMEEPVWKDSNRTRIGFLDAAYLGTGGDRCVFGEMQFGEEAVALDGSTVISNLIRQDKKVSKNRQLIALIETLVVPIKDNTEEIAEDQIGNFVKAQCESRGISPEHFFFDSGMKSSLVSSFSRIWSNKVVAIDCGGKPSEKTVSHEIDVKCCDFYSKYITELWYSVRQCVEARQFRGMTEDVMMEFSAREYGKVGGNKIEVETKEKMKVKTSRSPDLADAVAIGLEGARRLGFVIRKLSNPVTLESDERWKNQLRRRAQDLVKSHSLNYAA